MKVIDLFSGMGGLASGFSRTGYEVTGFDINPRTAEIFEINGIGNAAIADLSKAFQAVRPASLRDTPLIVTGGPPCRPWSSVNRRPGRTRENHPDYWLLSLFFDYIEELEPEAFILENVPPVKNDPVLNKRVERLLHRYSIASRIITYGDYGAATVRKRFFLAGFVRRSGEETAEKFFHILETEYADFPRTVGEVIDYLVPYDFGEVPDHHWPRFRTIEKYRDKYETGRFGWYRLDADRPARSFGNIMKTYILHPYAGNGHGIPLRVISVREAMEIMGFDPGFRFPEGMSMTDRYQMVADAVSPVFSEKAALALREIMNEL